MLTIRRKATLFYSKFAQETSKDSYCPLPVTVLIQLISHCHSLSLFLIPTSVNSLQNYALLPVIRNLMCLTAFFPYFDSSSLTSMVPLFYSLFLLYFVLWIGLVGCGLYFISKNQPLSPRFTNALTSIFLFHSRVLFFPIHYFLLITISDTSRCLSSIDITPCSTLQLSTAIIFCALNITLAFCKEISFYQIMKGKNTFSCKNNNISLLLLIHKTTLTFLFAFFSDSVPVSRLSAVLNLLVFTSMIFVIYFKLPFYQMALNQVSMAFSGISLVFSVFYVLTSFDKLNDNSTVELILYLLSTLVVKILLQFLQNLLSKILRFEYWTPEQAVHLPILLKSGLVSSYPFPQLQKRFPRETISYLGLLIDLQKPENQNIGINNEYDLYTKVIEKFQRLLQKNPHSAVLRLCMARIYLKKLKTGVKAVNLLRNINQFSQAIPVKNSVETVVTSIAQIFVRYNDEEPAHLNVLKYFTYREMASNLKQQIQAEVSNHTEFWKELNQEKVDVFKMINTSQSVESRFLAIRKLWNKYVQVFSDSYGVTALLYGVYLQTVRDLSHEGKPIISNYFHHRRNKTLIKLNRVLNVLEESAAVVVGSIENDKLGRIIDASASVKPIFNITKDKLLGQKVDILMPSLIAKRHDNFIHSYNQAPRLKMNVNMNSLGRTMEGRFFSLEVTLKAFPFMKNGVCVVSFLKKTSNTEPTLLVGDKGTVVDWSKEIEDYFKIDKAVLKKLKIQQLSTEFEDIMAAFNMSYNHHEKSKEDLSSIPITSLHEDKNITQDPFFSKPFLEGDTIDDRPLLYRADDTMTITMSPPRSRKGTRKFSEALTGTPRTSPQIISNRPSRLTRISFDVASKSECKDTEAAMELCERYKEGTKMTLTSICLDESKPKHEKQYFVKVEPLYIAKSFYKLVKISEISNISSIDAELNGVSPTSPQKKNLEYRSNKTTSLVKTELRHEDSFADNFPSTSEKAEITNIKQDKDIRRKYRGDSMQVGQSKVLDSVPQNSNDLEHGAQSQSQRDKDSHFLKKKVNVKSSVKDSSSHKKNVSKTLSGILSNEKIRPTTKLSIFVVYFAMLAVVAMTAVDYIFAGRSIDDMSGGVLIKDTENKRLFHSVISWQYILVLYSGVAQYILPLTQSEIYKETILMLQQNEILKASLQNLNEQRIVDIFFEKRVTMYDPSTQTIFNNENTNSLVATNILGVQNLFAANFTYTSIFQAIQTLRESPGLMFTMNNTANDYFVASEQELIDTETIIGKIIDENIQLLEIILGFEGVALVLLVFLLVLVVKVVVISHSKAFKALISIHPQSISKRLTNLKTFNDHLQNNIEFKNFGSSLSSYLDILEKASEKSKTKLDHFRYSQDKLVYKGLILYMMRYLSLALFFVLCVCGMFIYSFAASRQSFDQLDSLNNKLSVTHNVGYKINSLLSDFCHLTLFYNRTDLPLRNQPSNDQVTQDLQILSNANSMLLNSLIDSESGLFDPIIEDFLKNDVCTFISDQMDYSTCKKATSDAPGLLSLNSKYIQQAVISIEAFRELPTKLNGQIVFQNFGSNTSNEVFTLQTCYEFLTARLFAQFQDEVEYQKENRLVIFIGILVLIFTVTLVIHLVPISKFKSVDIALRRVLKIIPYEVIQQNKVYGFFLAQEFVKEIEVIRKDL